MDQIALPQVDAEASAIQVSTNELTTLAQTLLIDTYDDMEYGTELLARIKATLRRGDETRTVLVKPLNEHVKMINAQFKKITDPLASAEQTIKSKMLRFSERQRDAERERRRVSEEKALNDAIALEESGHKLAADLTLSIATKLDRQPDKQLAPTTTASGASAGFRMVWDFEITDFSKVPDEYKVANETFIRQSVVSGGKREIPGVRVFQKEQVSVRGSR